MKHSSSSSCFWFSAKNSICIYLDRISSPHLYYIQITMGGDLRFGVFFVMEEKQIVLTHNFL